MSERKYYHAYDDRYRQVHSLDLQWSYDKPAAIVKEMMDYCKISKTHRILEIGCGEGRDAAWLLLQGYDLLATDASHEAVCFCQRKLPGYAAHFQVLDCIAQELDEQFDFIYAVAVVHMLVLDEDRDAFYAFIRNHLKANGTALICTMGDGSIERQSDIAAAFDLQDRTHQQTGKTMKIAGTSCRMVSFQTFDAELERNGLQVIKQGVCSDEPNFNQLMFAAVKRKS